jgi:hypothetical protein
VLVDACGGVRHDTNVIAATAAAARKYVRLMCFSLENGVCVIPPDGAPERRAVR